MVRQSRSTVVSSFMIIKGSMIEETYAVFQGWDFVLPHEDNLRQMRDCNSVGAASASWLRDIYKVLHRRFDPNGADRALVDLAKSGCSYRIWKPLLLWHMTRDEFLFRNFLVEWLFPHYKDGALRVRSEELYPYLQTLHNKNLIKNAWSESTLTRVASGLLRMTTDFGLMKGTVFREFDSYHLPEESFLYLLHAMTDQQPNAREVVHSPDWRMYLLDTDDVEREIFRLHQYRKLHYEVAGSISQLNLPCKSAAAYAKALAV